MRWMWIDRIVELTPRQRLVAIKNITLAEDHLHEHFPARRDAAGRIDRPALPIMPASLIVEGMAQTAGILVGHAEEFKEKVILAKVGKAELDADVVPGLTLRYTATILQLDKAGASTAGVIELIDPARHDRPAREIGRIDLVFSHIDQNMAGIEFPAHNFVFGEGFKTLLRMSGIDVPE